MNQREARRLAHWLAILRQHGQLDYQWECLDGLAENLDLSASVLLLELFDLLTEPHLGLSRFAGRLDEPWGSKLCYRKGIGVGSEDAWVKTVEPNMKIFAMPVLALVQKHLSKSFQILLSVNEARVNFDPQSFHRKRIEKVDQMPSEGAVDFLVDAGRDALEWLVRCQPSKGRSVIELWLESGVPLLQRLALHGATKNRKITPIQRVRYLLEDDRLSNWQLRYEANLLLKTSYKNLSVRWRRRLIDAQQRPRGRTPRFTDLRLERENS